MDESFIVCMVTFPGNIVSFFRLIRWPNLLIVAATQILIRYCVIVPLLAGAYMEPQLSHGLFIMLVIATVFITAGGYAINDYFDRKIDLINKPGSLLIGTQIYPRHAMAYHLFLSITGVVLGTWVAAGTGQLYLGLVFFMVSGLLWFYSTTYKRQLLVGNIIVALLTALVPFLVLLFEMPLLAKEYGSSSKSVVHYLMIWVLGFSFFAFLLNLIREIVKDAHDFEGDRAYGKRTITVVWGARAANGISVVLALILIALLTLAWLKFIRDKVTLIYFLTAIVLPLIVVIVMLLRQGSGNIYSRISSLLKIVMITGLGYMIVVNLIINSLR